MRIFSRLGLALGFFTGLYNYNWTLGQGLLWFLASPFIGLGVGVLLAHLFGRPFKLAFADVMTARVGRIKGLIGSITLALRLRREWREQEHVGIMLPPSVASTLINIGAAMSGKTSVNLNYTAGKDGLESAISQAGLKPWLPAGSS